MRFLTVDAVREVADILSNMTIGELQTSFDPIAFTKAKVSPNPRPGGWDDDGMTPGWESYQELVEFWSGCNRWERSPVRIGKASN